MGFKNINFRIKKQFNFMRLFLIFLNKEIFKSCTIKILSKIRVRYFQNLKSFKVYQFFFILIITIHTNSKEINLLVDTFFFEDRFIDRRNCIIDFNFSPDRFIWFKKLNHVLNGFTIYLG